MAAVHKIVTDFYEDTFSVIALHSILDDYAMVYALNLCLKSNFSRTTRDLELFEQVPFPIFEWKDTKNDRYLTLITNNVMKEESVFKGSLFENEPSFKIYHAVPEFKEADYILKIEDEEYLSEEFVKELTRIPKVVTAYKIEIENLKSKTNLIF